jgi:hypothetical protein
MGGRWPAEAYRNVPVEHSSSALATVVTSAPGRSRENRSSNIKSEAGPCASWERARQATRSCPIVAAAASPRPTTSPTAITKLSSESSSASYQSPPTSRIWAADRYKPVDGCLREHGKIGRQHRPLELLGGRPRLVGCLGSTQGLGDLCGQGPDRLPHVAGREMLGIEDEHDGADRRSLDHQRQRPDRAPFATRDAIPGRIAGSERVGGFGHDFATGSEGLAGGRRIIDRQARHLGGIIVGQPAHRHELQVPVLMGQGHATGDRPRDRDHPGEHDPGSRLRRRCS